MKMWDCRVITSVLLLLTLTLCRRSLAEEETSEEYQFINAEDAEKFIHEQNWLYSLESALNVSKELKSAVLEGDVEQLRALLHEERSLTSNEICTLARLALIEGHVETAEQLIRLGFKIDELDLKKLPKGLPANLVVLLNDLKQVKILFMLLDYGTDIYALNSNGETPIHGAAKKENWFIIDVLLKRLMQKGGPYHNVIDKDGLSMLHILSAGMNSRFVKQFLDDAAEQVLIDLAIPVSSQFRPGYTALHFAAERCRSDTLKILAERGADPNVLTADGRTALHLSCKPFWYDPNGKTFSAAFEKNVEI